MLAEAILIGLVIWGVLEYERSIDARTETRETVGQIDGILIALLDAESGERGYLITGDDSYLKPYNDGLSRLGELLENLAGRVEPGSTEQDVYDRMVALTVDKLAAMDEAIQRRRGGEAADVGLALSGRMLMDSIRAELAVMHDVEAQRLDERIARSDRLGIVVGVASIVLALMTLATAGGLVAVLRRRQESEALRATAAAKDEFVGFVSHEIRTPLAVIAGNARLLADAPDTQFDASEALSEISVASERLQDILDTLLSLSKAESGVVLEVEPILLHRVAQRVRRHHRVRFPERQVEVISASEVPPALGDRRAVEQVLINLLSNAEKYGAPDQAIVIGVDLNDGGARVRVENRGDRLTPGELDHVFEPFFRMPASAAAAPGVGLGLTVCHRLIAAQGGRMNAEALPEGGACFSFVLPLAPIDPE